MKLFVATLGDPHSINIAALASFADDLARAPFCKLLIGSRWQWEDQLRNLEAAIPVTSFAGETTGMSPDKIYFWDVTEAGQRPAPELTPKERGEIATKALYALRSINAERLAVLTCPIDKAACSLAGFEFGGQTEFFETLWQAPGIMLLAGPKLRVGLATNHLAISEVAAHLSQKQVTTKLRLLASTLRDTLHIPRPRIAVCGLNPHCSDGGLFGWEEAGIIEPAIQKMQMTDPNAELSGPWPADTVFHRALEGRYDAVLAMYHDQGLGPFKTVHFHEGVNITGGLRHLRISPDHGPARDLFLSKEARFDSFRLAWSYSYQYLLGS